MNRIISVRSLVGWCALYLQVVADLPPLATTKPRGQETPYEKGTPIPNTGLPPFLSHPLSVFSSHLSASSPYQTLPTNFIIPDLPLPVALDGPVILALPLEDSSTVNRPETSGMDGPSRPLVMAYYPDWAGQDFPPEEIDFSLYDWLDFAFALPSSKFELVWDDEDAPSLLSRLVTAAHAKGTKVKLSIGGWTGSKYFSPAVATEANRRIFSDSILTVYNTYNLDGIDLDWEYPGHEGNEGNMWDPADTANFLAFLKMLRATLPSSAKISAAVQTIPFLGQNGDPIDDTSQFGAVFDWVLLMNYDTWESTSPPGPNAPLYDACNNSTQPASSASAGVVAWAKSGFPVSKLVLGLPSYGGWHHSWHDHEDGEKHHLHEEDSEGEEHWWNGHGGWSGGGDDDDGDEGEGGHEQGGVGHEEPPHPPANPGSAQPITVDDSDGQVQFRDLVRQGVLTPLRADDGSVQYAAAGGFERRWDSCSETPFLRSTTSGQIVTYDDTESLALKARFAKEVGMLGVNIFDVHGDTDEHHLINAIRRAIGL
ncbi:hypothetical protein NMY22_g645 [Coprinellus aureogranulatus]|nr:hypothetical protein NMY22_g645 [Coprinellus aureogranulatus]